MGFSAIHKDYFHYSHDYIKDHLKTEFFKARHRYHVRILRKKEKLKKQAGKDKAIKDEPEELGVNSWVEVKQGSDEDDEEDVDETADYMEEGEL